MAALIQRGAVSFSQRSSTLFAPSQRNIPFTQAKGSVRYGANLKAIRGRINSVKNMEKITKTMKMIASSRLKAAQTKMEKGRPFYEGAFGIMDSLPKPEGGGKSLIIAVCADRGLCGGINSSVAKHVKEMIKSRPNSKIIPIGEKAASLLGRDMGDRIPWSAGEIVKGFTFDTAGILADRIMNMEEKFDDVVVVYNRFNSVVSFSVTEQGMDGAEKFSKLNKLDNYQFEEEAKLEHIHDFFEFQLSTLLFHAISENATSELGARMSAMDSASKNAKEMYKNLNTTYNRARQATITTELTEIISGAAAVEKM